MTFWHEALAIAAGIAAYDILKGVLGWLLLGVPFRRSRFARGWWES